MGNSHSLQTGFTLNGLINSRTAICSASENGSTTCLLSDSTSAPTLFDCTTVDNTNFACISRNSAYSNANCQGQNIDGILQVVCTNGSNNSNNLINLTITTNDNNANLSWSALAPGTTYYVIRSSNGQPQILAQTQNTSYVDNNVNGNYEYIIATRIGDKTAATSNPVFNNRLYNKNRPSPLKPSPNPNPPVPNPSVNPTPTTPSYKNSIIITIIVILLIIIIIIVLYPYQGCALTT